MTDNQIKALYNALEQYYNDDLVNPDHQPKIFKHQVEMFKYYKRDVWDAVLQSTPQ